MNKKDLLKLKQGDSILIGEEKYIVLSSPDKVQANELSTNSTMDVHYIIQLYQYKYANSLEYAPVPYIMQYYEDSNEVILSKYQKEKEVPLKEIKLKEFSRFS